MRNPVCFGRGGRVVRVCPRRRAVTRRPALRWSAGQNAPPQHTGVFVGMAKAQNRVEKCLTADHRPGPPAARRQSTRFASAVLFPHATPPTPTTCARISTAAPGPKPCHHQSPLRTALSSSSSPNSSVSCGRTEPQRAARGLQSLSPTHLPPRLRHTFRAASRFFSPPPPAPPYPPPPPPPTLSEEEE